ncbi:hypothetical protein AAG906_038325 [Vitis piasezkii]
MMPFELAPDNRPLSNGPSSIASNHITHLGVLTTTWHAVSINANFMRWFGLKWRYLKVQWDETSSIPDLECAFFLGHGSCLDASCSESTSNFTTLVSTGKLLSIEPLEPKFPFELKKQISCSLQLPNKIENHVVFKVKTMNLKKYRVHPNTGIVLPRSTCDVIVTMRAQKEAPSYLHYKDNQTDITTDMFNKDSGHIVEECKLKVVYISPPQPPSPVPDGSEEGPSPKDPSTDNGNRHGNGPKGKILFYVVRSLLMVRRPPLPLL